MGLEFEDDFMHVCLSMRDSGKELKVLCTRGAISLQKPTVHELVNLFVETTTFGT